MARGLTHKQKYNITRNYLLELKNKLGMGTYKNWVLKLNKGDVTINWGNFSSGESVGIPVYKSPEKSFKAINNSNFETDIKRVENKLQGMIK